MLNFYYSIKNFKIKMARISFEFGGIQENREVSKTSLVDYSYTSKNIRNLTETLRSRYGLNFEAVLTDFRNPKDSKPIEGELERLGIQSPRVCLLRNGRISVSISNNDREVREAMLTHSWDRGYMDERISYRVLTGYIEGDFGNGEAASIESLIEECAQKKRREFSICSDEESARIDTR